MLFYNKRMLIFANFIFVGVSFAAEDAQQSSWYDRVKVGFRAGFSCSKKIINVPFIPLVTGIGLGYSFFRVHNGDMHGYVPLVGFCAWQGYQAWKIVTLPCEKNNDEWVRFVLKSSSCTSSECLKKYRNEVIIKSAQKQMNDDIKRRMNKTDAAQLLQTMSNELERRAQILMELDAQTGDFFAWIIKTLPDLNNVDRSSMTLKEKVSKRFGLDQNFKMVVEVLTKCYNDKYGFEIIDEKIDNYLKSYVCSIIDVKMRKKIDSFITYPFLTGFSYNDSVRLCWRLLKEYTILSYVMCHYIDVDNAQNVNVTATLFNGHMALE